MTKILCVVGARPNFPKVAPILRALRRRPGLTVRLVYTGQHYDDALTRAFFADLDLPPADIELAVQPGPRVNQNAEIGDRFLAVLEAEQPQGIIVVGDVDSTRVCATATRFFSLREGFSCQFGRRLRPLLLHVEAGLRSFDPTMPEEANRELTDRFSDLLFVTEEVAVGHLQRAHVPEAQIAFVGNVMIDTLRAAQARAMASDVLLRLGLSGQPYGIVTLHRPSNVDEPTKLRALLSALDEIAVDQCLVFPVHPRTQERLVQAQIALAADRWRVCPPLGYLDFLRLLVSARLVLTDSGGIQEETTALGVPCLTLRDNTERPVTIVEGTNRLAGTTPETIRAAYQHLIAAPVAGTVPPLWDGHAAERIADVVVALFPREPREPRETRGEIWPRTAGDDRIV